MAVEPSDIIAFATSALTGAIGWLTGRRRTVAEARNVEARADLAQVETVEHLLAQYRLLLGEHQRVAADSAATASAAIASAAAAADAAAAAAATAVAAQAAEVECMRRAERIEADLQAEREERRAEVRRLVERIRVTHPTPRLGYSAVTVPADPRETPPDGHRLSAPNLPTREDSDPTPDLHESKTPR